MCLPKLSDEERDEREGLLTYNECKQVLPTCPNEKSPGEAGFTVEVVEIFNEAYEGNELSISERRGIILCYVTAFRRRENDFTILDVLIFGG